MLCGPGDRVRGGCGGGLLGVPGGGPAGCRSSWIRRRGGRGAWSRRPRRGQQASGAGKNKGSPAPPCWGEAWGSKHPTVAEKASEAKVAKLRHQGFPGDPSTQY